MRTVRTTCGSITANGTPCRRRAVHGGPCAWHDTKRKPVRFWSRQRLWKLASFLEDGLTDAQIAKKLGTTANAVNLARKRHGIPSRTELLLSAREAAKLLGFGCPKKVVWLIEIGAIQGRLGQRRGANRQWYVTRDAILTYLEHEPTWPTYDPAKITDPVMRDWATEIRNGVRYLSLTEVAERTFVEPPTVHQWIKKGYLRAERIGRGNHVVREDALADFKRPRIGGGRARA